MTARGIPPFSVHPLCLGASVVQIAFAVLRDLRGFARTLTVYFGGFGTSGLGAVSGGVERFTLTL